MLVLPELSEEEALQFIRELIAAYRPVGFSGYIMAPFEERAVERGVNRIAAAKNGGLLPRHIIQVLDYALGSTIQAGADQVTNHLVEGGVERVMGQPDHDS